jgi:hypothetical protein
VNKGWPAIDRVGRYHSFWQVSITANVRVAGKRRLTTAVGLVLIFRGRGLFEEVGCQSRGLRYVGGWASPGPQR